ncbi:helicase SNF [Paraliobacillus quinghaiensis]|uniref:Helicase SNF n=1 Tax=Paraliobacillus quinghaiensis TaxID=470815 RepID=A0A917TRZ2_9BACI|nr:DEAD/DEAH box helicase [Paraliobacillus quinghaiensis]GGM35259.1 helicase SNF [Paraliobacillus quinghaiensis]
MRTFFLEKLDIVKITGQRFYKRGYDYFKKGRVIGLSYNPTINTWSAQVRGASNYHVRIFFFDDDELEGKCDCPAYATHFTCKHIAAVLLAISHNGEKQQPTFLVEPNPESPKTSQNNSDPFTLRMLEAFGQSSKSHELERKALQVEYTVSHRKNPHNAKLLLEVELRVGINKLYIIKDIRPFLTHIKKEQPYPVTNTFTYDPIDHFFTEEDQHIINQLIQAYQNEILYDNEYGLNDKRAIRIPPNSADKLLESIITQSHVMRDVNGKTVSNFYLEDKLPHLNFPIDVEDNERFLIDFSALLSFTYFEGYGYLFKENTFYQTTTTEQRIIEQLFNLLPYRTKQVHRIAHNKMEAFVSNVIPELEKIGNLLYSEETNELLTITSLTSKVYLDEVQNTVTANLIFQYGDHELAAYQQNENSNLVIKRNTKAEQFIIRLLEQAGFHYIDGQFQLFNNENIYRFLHERLAYLENHAIVYLTDNAKKLMSEQEMALDTTISLNKTSGMLDVSFDVNGISETDVQHILHALVEKKRYYRIPEGPLVALENDSFDAFHQFIEELHLGKQDLQEGHVHVSAARSLQVEESFPAEVAHYQDTFEHMLTALKHPEDLKFDLPDTLEANLRDYQYVGFQWFKTLSYYQLGGILADDMGLGKTIQTISYMLSEKAEKEDGSYKALVIAPASLVYNWKKEFGKFAPSLRTQVIVGAKGQRNKLVEQAIDVDVFITSYPLIRKDKDLYASFSFDALILDEAQAIKNHLTLTAKAVRSLTAKHRFALSGTPIENALDELWSIFHTISPGFFGTKKHFSQLDPSYISTITRPFILRRLKREVLEELPDKIETEQYSELTKNQKQVYLAYVEKMQDKITETIEEKGFEKGKLEILAGITRLRQICCHPSLFLENYTGKSGKLEHLKELVAELRESGKRLLIFSQFSSMLKIINKTLQTDGHEVFYLDGSTPSEQRLEMADAFNEGNKSIFLISLKAGGTGLNLTGADTVVLFDLWWNPAVEEQAAGRAHRIGQKKVVQVIRLITEGTIEEKIYQLQQEKRELVDQIIKPGETMLSKLSETELRELLTMER